MENKMSDDSKRKQHCTACRNHDKQERKTSHKCPYEGCECLLCQLTNVSRTIMRHQQRLWRHLKEKNEVVEQHGKKQVCDKCRNHEALVSKRNHKGSCPFEKCNCALCMLTDRRRDVMRHQQRVRRSATVTATDPVPTEHHDAFEYVQKTKMDLKQRFGDTDGYSSDENGVFSVETPSTQEENRLSIEESRPSFSQSKYQHLDSQSKHQYINRYREEEEISPPVQVYQLCDENSELAPLSRKRPVQASTSGNSGAKPKILAAPYMKEELLQHESSNCNPDAPLELSPAQPSRLQLQLLKFRKERSLSYPHSSYQLQPDNSLKLASQHQHAVVKEEIVSLDTINDNHLSQQNGPVIPNNRSRYVVPGPNLPYQIAIPPMPVLSYRYAAPFPQHPMIRPPFHHHP